MSVRSPTRALSVFLVLVALVACDEPTRISPEIFERVGNGAEFTDSRASVEDASFRAVTGIVHAEAAAALAESLNAVTAAMSGSDAGAAESAILRAQRTLDGYAAVAPADDAADRAVIGLAIAAAGRELELSRAAR